MVSLYVKGKENGHVQAYAPTGAMAPLVASLSMTKIAIA